MDRAVYEYISKHAGDPIVEWKTCAVSGEPFAIFQSDLDFYEKISPTFNSKKYQIPTPTLCPEERQRLMLMVRNERKLYHRKCDRTSKKIISMYKPDAECKVYDYGIRWSDERDATEYEKVFDDTKPFFQQFGELLRQVPRTARIVVGSENCDYTNFGGYNKDCYLSFDMGRNERVSYGSRSYKNINCLDIGYCWECENSYNLIDCTKCIKTLFSINSEQCYNSKFCYNCSGCNNCTLCSNLTNQEHCFLNKKYSQEEYLQLKTNFDNLNIEEQKNKFNELLESSIHKNSDNLSCHNVVGNHMKNCKNCFFAFGSQTSEDSKYMIDNFDSINNYDDIFCGNKCSNSLGLIGCENTHNSLFCFSCWQGSEHLIYCDFCISCKNCFGCTGLRNKEYHIFNKPYSKDDYEIEVGKIISKMQELGEWGQFFLKEIGLFGYNETVAQEYFPLTKDEAIKRGYEWMDKEYPINIPEGMETVEASELGEYESWLSGDSETSSEGRITIDDSILNKAIICEVSGRPFRMVKIELEFYRKHNLPLPRKHPDVRHMERMRQRPGRELFLRKCDKCWKEMLSVYTQDSEFKVYCESCYNKEIYS